MKTIYLLTLACGDQVGFASAETAHASLQKTYSARGQTLRVMMGVTRDCFTVKGLPVARGETIRFMEHADHL